MTESGPTSPHTLTDGDELLRHIAELAPSALVSRLGDGAVALRVEPRQLALVVSWLAAIPGARLADLFADDAADPADPEIDLLRVVWALDPLHCYLIVETEVAGFEYAELSGLTPAAFLEECEIYEQYGLRPAGGRLLNRVAVPPVDGHDIPRLKRAPRLSPRETHAPHSVEGAAFEFPFGPVRMVGAESLYYGLVTSGEEVIDVYLLTWHKHRGLEWRMRGMTPDRALFLVERIEGLSAVGQGWAFANAVEHALGIVPSAGAMRTRAVALELERLFNHAAALAALCQSTGLSVGQAGAEIALEQLLRVNAAAFGHRYLFGVLAIGGVTKAADLDALGAPLRTAVRELQGVARRLATTNSFLDRLEATGVLGPEAAEQLGLVGPVARAAGRPIDTRTDHVTRPYDGVPVRVASRPAGDVYARFQVFTAEIDESARLIDRLVEKGLAADIAPASAASASRSDRVGIGWAESARGESLAWVRLDADGTIARARVRPASVRNWRAFDDACRSQNVFTDVPIIEASFWLTTAGTAR